MFEFIIVVLFLISCMLATLMIILANKAIKEENDTEGLSNEFKE